MFKEYNAHPRGINTTDCISKEMAKARMYDKTLFNGTPKETMSRFITQCPHCNIWNAWHRDFHFCSCCGKPYEVDTTSYDNGGLVILEDI